MFWSVSPNLSVTSPTSQHILQHFHRFIYVTAHSPTLPLLHLRHSSFSSPYFASPTSQALHLTLIVPRAWEIGYTQPCINCQGKSATHFVYSWSRKTLPYTHLEATSYIPQQGHKAFTSEPLSYLLQAVTKISTLYNFYEWRV